MANKEQILDKIARNMKQRGFSAERVGETTEVTKSDDSVLVVSYADKQVQSPMGGVSDATSPFLGIGIAGAGSIKITGAAGDTTIALIMSDAVAATLLAECAGKANDIILQSGDDATATGELARIAGHADVLGLGE